MTTAIAASAPTLAEIHQASIVNIFGFDVNPYALAIIAMVIIFLFALRSAHRAQRLDWLDMITRDGTKVSTTKILQLVGGVVGTFIIIKVTLQGTLTWDLFAIYLSYVASIDGFSKLIMAKYGAAGSDDSAVPYKKPEPPAEEPAPVVAPPVVAPPVVAPTLPPTIPPQVIAPAVNTPIAPHHIGGGAKAGAGMPDD